MDIQLEKANTSDGNEFHNTTTPEKFEADVDEVENAPSNRVDHISYLNNSRAVRGDDSDGKIAWNVKSRIAACSLMIFYVGESFSNSHTTLYMALTHSRLSDPSLFRIRHTQLRSCRYRGRRKDSLAAGCICFGSCIHFPICGQCARFGGSPGNCPWWILSALCWLRSYRKFENTGSSYYWSCDWWRWWWNWRTHGSCRVMILVALYLSLLISLSA
jgi:hypothetical protein